MEKVSVVIPSYNSSSYIMRAVESALNQTYDNLEVIVADDASTDDTCTLVHKIEDPRVKLIERTENGGAAAARNSAIHTAKGRYIAFLDSDDYWLPNKLSVQIGKMQEEAASFSCTNYVIKSRKDEVLFNVPEKINYKYLLRGNIIGTSTVVYDTGTLGKIYMPALPMAEDFATWLNILRQCDAALGIRQPMAYRIRRNNSLSSRIVVMKYFTYRVYRETQGLSTITSLYYLFGILLRGLWKRLRQVYVSQPLTQDDDPISRSDSPS